MDEPFEVELTIKYDGGWEQPPEGYIFAGRYGCNYHIVAHNSLNLLKETMAPVCGIDPIRVQKISQRIYRTYICSDCLRVSQEAAMIGRERIKELESIEQIDDQISKRQSKLNELARSLEPQILTEEIVELRSRRTELEDGLVREVVKQTGTVRMSARLSLIKHNWDVEAAVADYMRGPLADDGTPATP